MKHCIDTIVGSSTFESRLNNVGCVVTPISDLYLSSKTLWVICRVKWNFLWMDEAIDCCLDVNTYIGNNQI